MDEPVCIDAELDLAALITRALDIADALGLHDVGIGLDMALVALARPFPSNGPVRLLDS